MTNFYNQLIAANVEIETRVYDEATQLYKEVENGKRTCDIIESVKGVIEDVVGDASDIDAIKIVILSRIVSVVVTDVNGYVDGFQTWI